MTDFVGSDYFSKSVAALKQAAKDKAFELAHGGCETFSQYQHECGMIKGLETALILLEDVFKQMAKEDRQ